MANWAPILEPETSLAVEAKAAVRAVAQFVRAGEYPPMIRLKREPALYENSLLFGYLALAGWGSDWLELTGEHLNLAIEEASTYQKPGLERGLSGLGWTVEHLAATLGENAQENDGAADPGEDLNEETDRAVLRGLARDSPGTHYDLLTGVVGCGVYFLERMPRDSAAQGLRMVLTRLENMAEQREDGIAWHSGPELLPRGQRENWPNGYYNLGIAHGIPGILYFLSEAAAAGIEPKRCRRLLDGAMAWFLAQRRPAGSRSWYGDWIADGKQGDSRLAWCYGDLGIVAVLLQVARRSGRADWLNFSRELLDVCMKRSGGEAEAGVNDAPLCHGAAGVAHIFNRIYQAEGDPRCRKIAVAWYKRALAMRREGAGIAGFSTFLRLRSSGQILWEPNPAFIDGAIGVALALLGAVTSVNPAWDRMLVLSGRDYHGRP